ncbi:MAG: oligosaccharide flippase family protein [Geobacteraceae bacterium]|nr:oligosaccharide flippase family protein [Geobacteraceae bacterium]
MMKAAARFAFDSGVNIALRGLTLASKFFLLVYLAKVLAPEQLGIYGLFTVTVSYALYLLGLDFYTFAQREMLSLPHKEWGGIIRNQFMFYAVVYLFVLPLLLLVFVAGWLPWQMTGWFYLILTLEHLSQELCRLLVVFSKVTLANVTLFFRGGAWVFAVMLLFWTKPELSNLTAIWVGWSVGVAISIVIAIFAVRKAVGPSTEKSITDWRWMRRGLKVAVQFLLGTLALRGLFTFDRYFLDLYDGKTSVGVYSFYMGIANALLGFADAGVISKLYPRIVATYRSGRYDEYRQNLIKLAISIIFLFVVFSFGLFVTINPVLHYIGREVYLEQINTLWILVGAMGVYCLGLVPHYALYAQSADRSVVVASVLSVFVFVVAAFYLTPYGGASGTSLAVLLGVGCLGTLKVFFYIRSSDKVVN